MTDTHANPAPDALPVYRLKPWLGELTPVLDGIDELEAAQEAEAARIAAIPTSATVNVAKVDGRCRGWAKVVRDGQDLPAPADVHGAGSLEQPYLRQVGSEELMGTDARLQGEENHHRKMRGWAYWIDIRDPADGLVARVPLTETTKRRIKAAVAEKRCSMPVEFLKGAGEVAAMVRVIHAVRGGMLIDDLLAE